MEYEELQTLWKTYDQKLENLEKMNKILLTETLQRKPQKKINRMMFQNIYGLVMAPIIMVFTLHTYFKIENVNVRFIIGCIFVLFSIANLCFIYYKGYKALQHINLLKDSVVESVTKVNKFKNIVYGKMNYLYLISFLLLSGIIMIIWDGLHFNNRTVLGFAAVLIITIVWTYKKSKMHTAKIENLKKDILELEEFK